MAFRACRLGIGICPLMELSACVARAFRALRPPGATYGRGRGVGAGIEGEEASGGRVGEAVKVAARVRGGVWGSEVAPV